MQPGEWHFVFSNLKTGEGLDLITACIREKGTLCASGLSCHESGDAGGI